MCFSSQPKAPVTPANYQPEDAWKEFDYASGDGSEDVTAPPPQTEEVSPTQTTPKINRDAQPSFDRDVGNDMISM